MLDLLLFAVLPVTVSCAGVPAGAIAGIVAFIAIFFIIVGFLCCWGRHQQKQQQRQAIENNSRKPLENVQSAYPPNPNAHYIPLVEQLEAKQAQCQPPLLPPPQQAYVAPQPIPGMMPSNPQAAYNYQAAYAMTYMQQQQVGQPMVGGIIQGQPIQPAGYQAYPQCAMIPPAADPPAVDAPEVVPKPVKNDSDYSTYSTSSV